MRHSLIGITPPATSSSQNWISSAASTKGLGLGAVGAASGYFLGEGIIPGLIGGVVGLALGAYWEHSTRQPSQGGGSYSYPPTQPGQSQPQQPSQGQPSQGGGSYSYTPHSYTPADVVEATTAQASTPSAAQAAQQASLDTGGERPTLASWLGF